MTYMFMPQSIERKPYIFRNPVGKSEGNVLLNEK